MIRLLWDTREESQGSTRGFGADEDTALIITTDVDTGEVVGEVVGTSGVLFADLGEALVHEDELG